VLLVMPEIAPSKVINCPDVMLPSIWMMPCPVAYADDERVSV
jgi:hypothetical protein